MKKNKKIIAIIFAVMLMCAALAACGSDSSDDPVVGTWNLSSVSAMGQELSVDDFLKAANSKEVPVMVFNGDNTVSVDMLGNKGESKWELKDGKYVIEDSSNTSLEFTLEDNKLTTQASGATLVFAKK